MSHYLRIIIICLLIFNNAYGQSTVQSAINQEKRIALVIGNGNYIGSVLANPENDAKAMADVLIKLGFEVYKYENLSQSQMKRAIDDFGLRLKNFDVGLFYYAGHGIQTKGFNYLIPIDAELKAESQVEYDCVQADRILSFMEESGAKVKILILDACRDNPFERSWTRSVSGRGLASMNAPGGTLIAYATAPGRTASDGSGKNGLYTAALLENISLPDITILQMFQNVRNFVAEKSQKQQIPWESTSLTGDFYFNPDLNNPNDNYNQSLSRKEKPISLEKQSDTSRTHLSDNPSREIRLIKLEKKVVNKKKRGLQIASDQIIMVTLDKGFIQNIKTGHQLDLYIPKYYQSQLTGDRVLTKPEKAGRIYIKESHDLFSEGILRFKKDSTKNYSLDPGMYFAKNKEFYNSIYVITKIPFQKPEYDIISTSFELGYMFTWVAGFGLYGEIGFSKDSFLENELGNPVIGGGIAKRVGVRNTIRLGTSGYPSSDWWTGTIDVGLSTRITSHLIVLTGLSFNYGVKQSLISLGIGSSF